MRNFSLIFAFIANLTAGLILYCDLVCHSCYLRERKTILDHASLYELFAKRKGKEIKVQ